MYVQAFASAAVAIVGLASASPETCGLYRNAGGCSAPDPLKSINGTMQFGASITGQFYFDQNIYASADCSGNSTLFVHAIGFFTDQGPVDDGTPNIRKFVFNYSQLLTQPQTDGARDLLRNSCPCGNASAWITNQIRYVQANACPDCDISILGGVDTLLGKPAFTLVNVSDNGDVAINEMHNDPGIGWLPTTYTEPYATYESVQSCTQESKTTMCGQYQSVSQANFPCQVLVLGDRVTSVVESFQYRGPANVNFESMGVYERSVTYYSDDKCTVLEATMTEEGNLGYFSYDQNVGLFKVQKQTITMTVTPAQNARDWAANLTADCPCGAAWFRGQSRVITSCPFGTCSAPVFNDFNSVETPNGPLFAYMARNRTGTPVDPPIYQEWIGFSRWSNNSNIIANGLIIALESTHNQGDLCGTTQYATSLCGTYDAQCYSDNFGDGKLTVELTGDGSNSTGEGRITWKQSYFNETGKGCDFHDLIYDLQATGFYSQDTQAVTPDVDGLLSIEVEFTAVTVTPRSRAAANIIQLQCPCNQTWIDQVPITLVSCTDCSDNWKEIFFPGGIFATPGFGVAQLSTVDNKLRISHFDNTTQGYSNEFDATSRILEYSQCPDRTNPQDFSNCWYLPCYRVTTTQNNAQVGLNGYFNASNGVFNLAKTAYSTTAGCEMQPYFDISTSGSYDILGGAKLVTGGYVTQFNQGSVSVTPRSTDGVALLSQYCSSCGFAINHPVGEPVTFGDNACNCQYLQDIAGVSLKKTVSYGVTKMWRDANLLNDVFRMTPLVESASDTVTLQFGRGDSEYAALTPCEIPHMSMSSNHDHFQGGDVFLVILFGGAALYFGIGMILNYQRTGGMKNGGTPIIPHITFWRALPGLISDGFRFTFLEQCGRKSRGKYESFGVGKGDQEGGYGAL